MAVFRKVTRISELTSDGAGNIDVNDIFRFASHGLDENGNATGVFEATGYVPRVLSRFAEQGIQVDESLFAGSEIE